MFGYLRGRVAERESDRVILDVGGLGFEVFASGKTLDGLKKGSEATLRTVVNFSQDAVAVYGFATAEEKEMFRRLTGVSRVGPKAALAILSAMAPQDLAVCVVSGDESALSRVPGIGKKTAQRIILELKEKIANEELTAGGAAAPLAAAGGEMGNARMEAVTALVALGYDAGTANSAVAHAAGHDGTVEGILKAALRQLGKGR